MNSALVTGGAGFIGSHLAERLTDAGCAVTILDDLSSGSRTNIERIRCSARFIEGDVRDPQTCAAAARGVDTVFHLAAIASVTASVEDPVASHEVTLGGTLNMLVAARNAGARRFVFSSSASVYGNTEQTPTTEDQAIAPESPYASAKAAAENYCRNFYALYGLETVVLRYFNVFGPRQSADSGYAAAVPLFVKATREGSHVVVYGDGLQTRDFVFVDNVAEANLRAAVVDTAAGRTYNIAGGAKTSVLDLLTILESISGRRVERTFHGARQGEVRHSSADITRARQDLAYVPSVSLEAGLRAMLGGPRSNGRPAQAAAPVA